MRREKTTGNTRRWTMLILFASLVLLMGHGTCMETHGPDEWGHDHHDSGLEAYTPVTFTSEPSTNRSGMTYRSVHLAQVKDCKNLCRREAHCRAYTYIHGAGTCRLKNGVPAPAHNGCCYSGVKRH